MKCPVGKGDDACDDFALGVMWLMVVDVISPRRLILPDTRSQRRFEV